MALFPDIPILPNPPFVFPDCIHVTPLSVECHIPISDTLLEPAIASRPLEPYYEQIMKAEILQFNYTTVDLLCSFNYPFVIMPTITCIDFSYWFDKPITMSKNITTLDFP